MRKLVLFLAACGADAPAVQFDAPPPTCNPVVGADCTTPFPSSYFEVEAQTATGVKLQIPAGILGKSSGGVEIRPDRLNGRDGFSPATTFLVYFAAGVDAAGLPGHDDIAATVAATSSVQILEHDTGARVPLFAELDANAAAGQRQALLIHPMVKLKPATRYIIALVGLHDRSGAALAPAPFVALRDGGTLTADLAALKSRYDDLFAKLGAAGVTRGSLSLAWDVVTSSDPSPRLVAMRDAALAEVAAAHVSYRVASATDTPDDAHRLRELQLVVTGPWYLDSSNDNAFINLGPDGQPRQNGTHDFNVTVEIPRCAATATAPVPYVVIGHGLFGNAKSTLADPNLLADADAQCSVLVGTDWLGTSTADLAIIAKYVLTDLNNIYLITDRQHQAHVNAQVMERLFATAIANDPAMAVGGHPVSDGKEAYYFGASDGGIQGGVFMALQQHIVRGVLNVPGCEWSLLLWRSTQFNPFLPVFATLFPDPLDRQLLTTAVQSEWDWTDPVTFATHLTHDPVASAPAKRIILQESIGDAQVTNISTEVLARTMGLDGLELVEAVYGVVEKPGPLESAYTQWDIHPSPLPPTGNVPAPHDNGAHSGIQQKPPLQEQIREFFHPDGLVMPTCGGACDFPQ